MTKKPTIQQRKFADKVISPLESHSRSGKTLKAPFAKLDKASSGKMKLSSWKDDCVPNILWACLLVAHLERDHYLQLFRDIIISTRGNVAGYKDTYITHNHMATLSLEEFSKMDTN